MNAVGFHEILHGGRGQYELITEIWSVVIMACPYSCLCLFSVVDVSFSVAIVRMWDFKVERLDSLSC